MFTLFSLFLLAVHCVQFKILKGKLAWSLELCMGGHLHFGPFPEFPRFLVWKASLRKTMTLVIENYTASLGLGKIWANAPIVKIKSILQGFFRF